MKKEIITKIFVSIVIIIAIISTSINVFGEVAAEVDGGASGSSGIKPTDITGEIGTEISVDTAFIDNIATFIQVVGTFIAVGVLMVIGIKYAVGSLEERANYKKTLLPYVIGCFILFGAATLAPQIKDMFTDMDSDVDTIGNAILRNDTNNWNTSDCWNTHDTWNKIYDRKRRRKSFI